VAVGLIAFWAAIPPLTAEPAIQQVAAARGMSEALFLCSRQNSLGKACVGAFAKALTLDAKADAFTRASDRRCQANQVMLLSFDRRV